MDTVCKVYFYGYLILAILTVGTLLNYRQVRKRSKQPGVVSNTSKFWIVVFVLSLQAVRIMYFSTAFFKNSLNGNRTSQMRCLEEWSVNLPALLEFINIFIIHDFLLRVYLVLSDQMKKYRTLLIVWTLSVTIAYSLMFII